MIECVNCGETLTYAKWWSEDCPKMDNLLGAGHVVGNLEAGPRLICPECREAREDDERVASGLKCGICNGYGG